MPDEDRSIAMSRQRQGEINSRLEKLTDELTGVNYSIDALKLRIELEKERVLSATPDDIPEIDTAEREIALIEKEIETLHRQRENLEREKDEVLREKRRLDFLLGPIEPEEMAA